MTVGGLTPETGGPAAALPTLCDALAALGAGVELVSVDLGRALRGAPVEPHGWRLTLVRGIVSEGLRLTWAPAFGRAVSDACARLGDPILHDNGVWLASNHAAVRVARRLRAPLIVSPRGMLTPWARQSKAAKKSFAWRFYQRSDLQSVTLFHATSEAELENLRSLGLRQPVAVVPNAVALPSPCPEQLKANDSRMVLYLARLTPKKGLDILLRVWLGLRPQGWGLVVAGPDENGYGTSLRRQLGTAAADAGMEFVGPVWGEEKWRLLRRAAVCVLPSHSENFGMVVAEALASGVPVITTTATPWRAIEEHRCGWWIPEGDESLAAALAVALELSDEERMQMGMRGRALIEGEYAPGGVARTMAEVYDWLLHGGAMPKCVAVA